MTVDLLPHQQRALAWMLHREREATKPAVAGGILGDDQGLGKTITAIALLLTNLPGQVRTSAPCNIRHFVCVQCSVRLPDTVCYCDLTWLAVAKGALHSVNRQLPCMTCRNGCLDLPSPAVQVSKL